MGDARDKTEKYQRKLAHELAPGEHVLEYMPYDAGAAALAGFGLLGFIGLRAAERLRSQRGTAATAFPSDGAVIALTERRLLVFKDDAFKASLKAQFRVEQVAGVSTKKQGSKDAIVVEFHDGSTFVKGEGKKHRAAAFAAAWHARAPCSQDQHGWVDPAFLTPGFGAS